MSTFQLLALIFFIGGFYIGSLLFFILWMLLGYIPLNVVITLFTGGFCIGIGLFLVIWILVVNIKQKKSS